MNKTITTPDKEIKRLMLGWYMTGAIAIDLFIAAILLTIYLILKSNNI